MKTLTDLGELLSKVTGLPERRVKFKPPGKEKLRYPCIMFGLSRIDQDYADDISYFNLNRYTITLMDEDPESILPDKILSLQTCKFNRFYTADGLNHWVFTLYF